ncbi:MAG: class I SAM-dependent methyltransferase [Verrucomicrobia bacterium]|nr:class I SAM-dependent methyltransferase [Verrucomicrobiota bacterium]
MDRPLYQHQIEIERNREAWFKKPLLREIYSDFYERILSLIDPNAPGRILEIGSGIGNLKRHIPRALCTDLFPNPWLDAVCDGYALPFSDHALSHVVLFDVFHHLEKPQLFLNEAKRVLNPDGKLIIFEPYISLASHCVYGMFHHEPIAFRSQIDASEIVPPSGEYYAAQGNATRIFFRGEQPSLLEAWSILHAEAFSSFSYLMSGGFSKPALYPKAFFLIFKQLDSFLSHFPKLFGARCLVAMQQQLER